ncbi:hypothetical protein EXIGLDRAFT_155378 [Exidia glandulosa HHB12029]|uniref:Uncharacterized protein n=1 Tax=Exidia glandulosa HHB12029 TaxID=1314781 RepID=A0A165QIL6_EXIGL|nr:hypothetical protein EXIGLDRAFT_155378 [Exidia glandulosa HHB12029]
MIPLWAIGRRHVKRSVCSIVVESARRYVARLWLHEAMLLVVVVGGMRAVTHYCATHAYFIFFEQTTQNGPCLT